jgi:hypothetical protein
MNEAYNEVIRASDRDRTRSSLKPLHGLARQSRTSRKTSGSAGRSMPCSTGWMPEARACSSKAAPRSQSAFGLIPRFSEDIDITVFREDIGQAVETAALDALSGKQRRIRLDAIRETCKAYINGPLATRLAQHAGAIGGDRMRLEQDPDDADGQTLLLWYPAAAPADDYIRSAVKIEAGAKSALDPHTVASVVPYIADDLDFDLRVSNVVTVEAERTFWDKIIILHGLRQWFDRRGVLRHGGQRVSRHYYDVHQLLKNERSPAWLENRALAADCATHARLFFGSNDLGLETAARGTSTLMPPPPMRDALRADYVAMTGMIFGDVPSLDAILASVEEVELRVNG